MKSVAALAALLVCPAAAGIVETRTMVDVARAVDARTLLVLDVDNTILQPVGDLGSDQWYYHIVDRFVREDGLSEPQAYAKADRVWNDVQATVAVEPVEALTPRLIAERQQAGAKTMALTARTLDLAERTALQLRSIGVSFAGHAPDDQDLSGGILFVGEHNDKGAALARLLKRVDDAPGKLVYADDKLKHVESVGRAARALGLPYAGFRYGAADERVARFNARRSRARTAP